MPRRLPWAPSIRKDQIENDRQDCSGTGFKNHPHFSYVFRTWNNCEGQPCAWNVSSQNPMLNDVALHTLCCWQRTYKRAPWSCEKASGRQLVLRATSMHTTNDGLVAKHKERNGEATRDIVNAIWCFENRETQFRILLKALHSVQ